MTRVEWTRLDGGDVEAVVAMFINRERPTSVRITPSRGDGGVDILDRRGGPGGSDTVYQIKRYCEPLTPRQKAEVESSLTALKSDPRWADLTVATWHLVLPWDPTPEAERWLQDLGSKHGVTAVWHGLTYVEQLAAKYPDVVDYYLHGGKARIEAAYQSVAALFGLDQTSEGLTVPQVADRVRRALSVLDDDPHYRYELHVGAGQMAGPGPLPGHVMSWVRGRTGAEWVRVDVIARCAASTDERPITIAGTLRVDAGSANDEAIRDFFDYGIPFTSPEGAFSGRIDAPGGLGGPIESATIRTSPDVGDVGDNSECHLEMLDPDGNVLAAVDVNRVQRSQGTAGFRVVFEESDGLFTIEILHNETDQRGTRVVSWGELKGKPVNAVVKALTFLSHCHAPNVGRLSVRHTPPHRGVLDPGLALDWPDEDRRVIRSLLAVARILSIFQEHSRDIVRWPNAESLTPAQLREWEFAAALLRGAAVSATCAEDAGFVVEVPDGTQPPVGGSFSIQMPLEVKVDALTIQLGECTGSLENATLVHSEQREGHSLYVFTTPDRKAVYRMPSAETETGPLSS